MYKTNRSIEPVAAALASGRSLIALEGVTKTFGQASSSRKVLKDVHLYIHQGEYVVLLGKSGSGKSTLLNLIGGLDRPTAGTVKVGGTGIDRLSENQLAAWRSQFVGIVFQFFHLLPTLTALENVILPMELRNVGSRAQWYKRALHLLEEMQLSDQMHQLPTQLSGGQQQRVAIARALANDPPVLLADEPTGNLDTQSAEVVLGILKQLVEQGKTLILVTHNPEITRYSTRVVTLVDGELAAS